jgi:hypothetical protein
MTEEDAPQDLNEALLGRTLTEEELDDLTDRDMSPAAITYSTQDFDVSGLVQRLKRVAILIPSFGADDDRISTAGFQRGFVWTKKQMDRFVESLLLGYPVPGIFLVKQTSDNRHLVLDGQQRLETLRRFYEGTHAGRVFTLENVGAEYKGLSYADLDESLQFKLNDSFLQATIVSSDGSGQVNEAVYHIFERLNAGGTQLTPHEIRVALYAGESIAFLEGLNQNASWRQLFGRPSPRIRDQELILRILALYTNASKYSRPLKSFLNAFMADHRTMTDELTEAGRLFAVACDELLTVGPRALRRPKGSQVNVAQTEAVFVGLMRAIAAGSVKQNLGELLEDSEFVQSTVRATADNDAVEVRIRLATEAMTR